MLESLNVTDCFTSHRAYTPFTAQGREIWLFPAELLLDGR
jgi:hypothetical protein